MKSLTIGKKTFLLALIVSLAGLLAVSVPLVHFQLQTFDETYRTELQTVTQIAAANLAPYLDFDEAEDAIRILDNLLVQRDIRAAVIFDQKGKAFARVGSMASYPQPTTVTATTLLLDGQMRIVQHPIEWKGSQRGVLVVIGDYSAARGDAIAHLWQSVISFGGLSCIFALGVAAFLQRFVSRPVKQLAAVAQQIRESADYSLRAPKTTNDEVGALTDAFNGMIQRIAQQETDLLDARTALEFQVRALAGSEARVRGIIASLAEALILIRPDGIITLANPRVTAVLGWKPEELIGHRAVDYLFPASQKNRVLELIVSAGGGTVCSAEIDSISQTGAIQPVESHWSRLTDDQGNIIGILAAFLDITERRNAAAELATANTRLIETSRRAGMAEIATNVLHNVGNTFNSVNVGITLVTDHIKTSKVDKLRAAAELLKSQGADAGNWLTQDKRGIHFPDYLEALAISMQNQRHQTLTELANVNQHIHHIKQIITTQQTYARVTGILEKIPLHQLIEHCLGLETTIHEARITIERHIPPDLAIFADRHKTLQIIANLLRNARDAIAEAAHGHGVIKITANVDGERVQLRITDNGSGIAPENLTRIFGHGFTTRQDGHGFGLHASALAAMEMKGTLTASSPGHGAGATFLLTLPIAHQ